MSDIQPYSKAIVLLLKKTVENNSPEWENIRTYRSEIQKYLSVIGLELVLKEEEGFAYVKQIVMEDDTTLSLVQRRQLSYEVSIILVVLRQLLADFDNNPTDMNATERYVSANEIKDEIRMFLPERYDKVKLERDLERYIRSVEDLGFLEMVGGNSNEARYRIHRIIKEKVTLDDLDLFKQKLEEYAGTI